MPRRSSAHDTGYDTDADFASADDRDLAGTSSMTMDDDDDLAATDASAPLASQSGTLRGMIEEIAKLVPESAAEQLGTLKDKALALADTAAGKASELGRGALEAVKKHPMQAALIGAGAAAVTWWLLSRRRAA